MAGVSFIKPVISVNAQSWTPYVRSITFAERVEMVDATTFGDDHRTMANTGIHGGTFSGSFNAQFGANQIIPLLTALLNVTDNSNQEVAVLLRRTDGGITAANPEFSFNVSIGGYTYTAALGQVATGSFTFPIVSKISIATS